jgi:hypothetical protein
MSIEVRWSAPQFKGKSKNIISRQLQILMWRFRAFLMRVRVNFSDVNGPKGGVDKRCIVSAKLRSPGKITIISEGMDYLEAFQTSLARLIRFVQRELKKQREKPIRINRKVKFVELKK